MSVPRLMSIAGVGLTTFTAGERPASCLFIVAEKHHEPQPYAANPDPSPLRSPAATPSQIAGHSLITKDRRVRSTSSAAAARDTHGPSRGRHVNSPRRTADPKSSSSALSLGANQHRSFRRANTRLAASSDTPSGTDTDIQKKQKKMMKCQL